MSDIHLRSDAADAAVTVGAGTKWLALSANASSSRSVVKRCQNPNASPYQITDGSGTTDGTVVSWYTKPLQAVTITGTITCTMWDRELNASVNAAPVIQIERCSATGTILSTIIANSVNEGSGEMPTTAGSDIVTLTAANVADTAISGGERLRITLWLANASAQGGTGTMSVTTTYYAQFWINGAVGGAGQARLAFTESLVELITVALTDSGTGSDSMRVGASGTISGTPTTPGTSTFTVRVWDATGDTATKELSITVLAGGTPKSFSDSGSGADTFATPSRTVKFTDSGAASDALKTPVKAINFPSSASASEALKLTQPTGLTGTGSAADSLSVTKIISQQFTGSGSASDSFRVTRIVTFTDAGLGSDSIAVPSFLTAGSGTDALGITSQISLTAAGSAADQLSIVSPPIPIALADSGSAADTLRAGVPIGLADAGSGAAALGIAAYAPQSDAGTALDTFAIQRTLALTEIGSGAGSIGIARLVAFAGSGAAAETLEVTGVAFVDLADIGSAADSLAPGIKIPLTTAGIALDAFAVARTVLLADSGIAGEEFAVTRTIAFVDEGSASDVLGISQVVSVPLADSGSGSDTLFVARAINFADSGNCTESLGLFSSLALAEAGACLEAIASLTATSLVDAGSALDTYAFWRNISLADGGSGDGVLGVIPWLTETGEASETLSVISITGYPGHVSASDILAPERVATTLLADSVMIINMPALERVMTRLAADSASVANMGTYSVEIENEIP